MASMKLFGTAAMVRKLTKMATEHPERMERALYAEGQIEMTESKRRCPVDITPNAPHPGQLRNSGHVQEPVRKGREISVTLAYGGAAADYAVHVHENPDAIHPVGQWKYLESVLNESQPHMGDRLARRLHVSKWRV